MLPWVETYAEALFLLTLHLRQRRVEVLQEGRIGKGEKAG